MVSDEDGITDAQLRKTVRKALRRVLKSIDREPRTLVIESDSTQADTSEKALPEIRKWLFGRR